ncbi:alpha-1,4-glucan--maltose-1-phosphate maltosyltransferase [Sediminivirga luteola]|uniref:alpha-1,4-glucan--maltose-1-phosphate maltosyltransferase n=1 Tax=Sediminivirga luteola TaxID=1774748 RepID=UPI001F568D7B|nr:alpha-1,4-glucan--maltose-1-phosphate maltosyltransferase [Sediminivirga luteola]MCI2266292.1 alpha-1,4-glucan--maltose-1-phosphate maltosyltransferase [Sediminivirga luteola]
MNDAAAPVQHFQRIPIVDPEPLVSCGAFPATAVPGEDVPVSATVFREGHDLIGVAARLRDAHGAIVERVPMFRTAEDVDRYHGVLRPVSEGMHSIVIEAWADEFATWRHRARLKLAAGVDVELMLAEGVDLLSRHQAATPLEPRQREAIRAAIAALEGSAPAEPLDRLEAALSEELLAVIAAHPIRSLLSTSRVLRLQVHRRAAGHGAWYEFFPRSEGAHLDETTGTWVSGTFATARKALERAAGMGFEVVYLPPIHPIGEVGRKGRNNTLNAAPGDPGSPWAVGSKDGGHDAIHPDLGDFADFDAFVARAGELGLEVALDLALQAAPDHPWVREHPEFFTTQLDGSIAYAENPPKKYQDIYPLNFDNDYEALRAEVLRIVELWISHGIRIFRVDNPHTKPVRFWEWLIATVHATHPDVVFLAEAFTRPAMMHALAKAGFQQSYSYFTWRNTREEIEEYLTELRDESGAFLRPNFFVNTPDILTEYLQFGGPAAFRIRAALAATSSPLWGVYAGFELCEHVARPGAEEYIDNEKYEYRPRDFETALAEDRSLAPYLTRLNEIRRAHPALGELRNIRFHTSEDDAVLVFSKRKDDDVIVIVLNVDPHSTRETMVDLDLDALRPYDRRREPAPELRAVDAAGSPLGQPGLPETFTAHDLLAGQSWEWGARNYVRLDPKAEPAHILHVRWPQP